MEPLGLNPSIKWDQLNLNYFYVKFQIIIYWNGDIITIKSRATTGTR